MVARCCRSSLAFFVARSCDYRSGLLKAFPHGHVLRQHISPWCTGSPHPAQLQPAHSPRISGALLSLQLNLTLLAAADGLLLDDDAADGAETDELAAGAVAKRLVACASH